MPSADLAAPDLGPSLAWITEWPLRGVEFALQAQQLQLEAWRCWEGSLQAWQSGLLGWWGLFAPRR